ncbi:Uncharacterised protein [Raoultella terrigena]|uniref:Uncharacterized protein n=1 Tax=Raoultella terrigena TaxID=577 RepID=A0A3P8JCA7_RAOTE|nr:Uncharacterised protein [Raoultella terrigena]
MEQADCRFQTQVRKVQVEARQIRRHTQTFIDIHQVRQAANVKIFIILQAFFQGDDAR